MLEMKGGGHSDRQDNLWVDWKINIKNEIKEKQEMEPDHSGVFNLQFGSMHTGEKCFSNS